MKLCGAIVLFSLLASNAPALGQPPVGSLVGQVVRHPDRAPLAEARVTLVGSAHSTQTAPDGRFRFDSLPVGGYVVQAGLAGHQAASTGVTVVADREVSIELILDPLGISTLPEVVVAEKEVSLLDRKLAGFYHRAASAQGYFITPEQMASHRPALLSQALRSVPGLNVNCRTIAANTCVASFDRVTRATMGNARPCSLMLFLDGVRFGPVREDMDGIVPGSQIAAIEAYRGMGDLPREFVTGDTQCGVIVVWLKPPEPRGAARR